MKYYLILILLTPSISFSEYNISFEEDRAFNQAFKDGMADPKNIKNSAFSNINRRAFNETLENSEIIKEDTLLNNDIQPFDEAMSNSEKINKSSLSTSERQNLDKALSNAKNINVSNLSTSEHQAVNEAMTKSESIRNQAFNETVTEAGKVDTSNFSEEDKQVFHESTTHAMPKSGAECGAILCLSKLDVFSEKCDHYIKEYFKIRAYRRSGFHKKFDPIKTSRKRLKYLKRCEGPKTEKKIAINLLYGFLYKKP